MARKDDVPVIPVAGGLQPRAAVAYMTIAALEVAWLCGAGPRMTTEVDVAAEHLEELVTEWGPDGSDASEAKVLARGLHGAMPVISGSGLTEAVAYRWKTQINENAKLPAFANELPELDHNEICGWSGAGAIGRFAAVFLDDPDTHPRVRDRIELTEGIIREQGHATFVAGSRGQTRVERVMSARAARGPRLAVPRGPARGRSHAGRRHRDAEVAPQRAIGVATAARPPRRSKGRNGRRRRAPRSLAGKRPVLGALASSREDDHPIGGAWMHCGDRPRPSGSSSAEPWSKAWRRASS